jgi:hypothetical protein
LIEPELERELTPSERIYLKLSEKPLLWARHYCPNHHKLETPKFHLEIIKAACQYRNLVIAAPREFAKSTIINFDFVTHRIMYKKKRFILIVSNPFKKGASYLESIKKELTENENLKTSFPPIKITKDAEGDSVFTHHDGFETKVMCKGVEQIGTIRGIKFKYSRPDLIICDDIEDDEMVKNPDRRKELQDYFDEALVPAGERGVCQIIVIGTVLHDDSLLSKLLSKDKYPEYHKMFYRARNGSAGNYTSLWPEKMSVEDLNKLEKEKPSVFAKEYQNDPVSGSNVRFDKKDFRYWRNENGRYILFGPENEVISTGLLADCKAAIACDLAWKEKRSLGADSTVILPGYLTPDSNILIEDYVHKTGMRPDEFIEQIFLMVERLEKITGASVSVGFEKAMLENVTQWMMKKEMREQNKFISTKELVWDADKETRIEIRLQPRYSQHSIFHKHGMGDLEHQLVRFPSATHDDIIDAEQGLVQLLKFPKGLSKPKSSDSMFDQVRQHAIDTKYAKDPKKTFLGFGNRNKGAAPRIPAKRSFF